MKIFSKKIAILIGITIFLMILQISGLFAPVDSEYLTILQRIKNLVKKEKNIKIISVGIDTPTLKKIGPWPLSFKYYLKVIEFLSKGGVTGVQFQTKGYGESKPVAHNTKPDGSDNPEGRAKNRRVEIKILD